MHIDQPHRVRGSKVVGDDPAMVIEDYLSGECVALRLRRPAGLILLPQLGVVLQYLGDFSGGCPQL